MSCSANVDVVPPSLAFKLTVWVESTADTVALKFALVALAAIVMLDGTCTDPLLLDKPTLTPPEGADAPNVTVHESTPEPVMDELAQERDLSPVGGTSVPLPLRSTASVPLANELLEITSCPEAAPAADGLNCTFT
ncbi:MAG TPA: hypothetical protein VMU48_19185 [Terracidiphilus sp.]|nr:hypothetical protein [Terracidiphilus sp.]